MWLRLTGLILFVLFIVRSTQSHDVDSKEDRMEKCNKFIVKITYRTRTNKCRSRLKCISLKKSLNSKILNQSDSFWQQKISQLFRWSWDRASPKSNTGPQTYSLHIESVFYHPNELNWVRFFKFQATQKWNRL